MASKGGGMPNGDYSYLDKEYGQHEYPAGPDHTSDCKHHCGCWAGPSRSGGPMGLDPLFGECPGNPKDGHFLDSRTNAGAYGRPHGKDYEIVVERRIQNLSHRAYDAEKKLKLVEPDKMELAEKLQEAQRENDRLTNAINNFYLRFREILQIHSPDLLKQLENTTPP